MKWEIDIIRLAISLIPWFLRNLKGGLSWITSGGSIWVWSDGTTAWGGGGSSRHIDWISAILMPLKQFNNSIATYADMVYYRLSITGQVIYLEHYLNDLYDPDLRRIFISEDNLLLPPFLYNKADNVDTWYLYNKVDGEDPLYLYNYVDYLGSSFIINVPNALPLTLTLRNRISKSTNQYKQAGVFYTIVNY